MSKKGVNTKVQSHSSIVTHPRWSPCLPACWRKEIQKKKRIKIKQAWGFAKHNHKTQRSPHCLWAYDHHRLHFFLLWFNPRCRFSIWSCHTLHIVLSCGQCINVTVTGLILAKYSTKEFGPDEDKIMYYSLSLASSYHHLLPSTATFPPKLFFRGSEQQAAPLPISLPETQPIVSTSGQRDYH